VVVNQVLYHLNHTLALLYFGYFLDRIFCFCLGPVLDCDPCVARITGVPTGVLGKA
jgi:hypothetical protein